MEEIFDVVNERNEIVGCQTRSEIHRLGLFHRAAHVLVFNGRGHLFLQKRSMKKDCFPGAWDSSAAGHLDRGESYGDCAARELREELGVNLPCPLEPLFDIAACDETGFEFIRVYRCQLEGPFQLDPEEIERGDWFELGEIDRSIKERPEDFASSMRIIWRRWRKTPAESF